MPQSPPPQISAPPGVSRLVLVADEKYPRYSEADIIALADKRLLLALARKEGASDFAKGTLIGLFSRDGGLSWDDQPHVIQQPFDDVGDLMSVSLFRTARGVHLLFLGRGPDAHADTRVYQMISIDEGRTWDKPRKISPRGGYHIVNNARVIATASSRLIVPAAWVSENIHKQFNHQRIVCLLSDDAGETWRESGEIVLKDQPLMEPGVAVCADGSLYMTIRTKLGVLYESRSRDEGATWAEATPSKLPSPAAPSTVSRDPESGDLWMFWINRPKGTWKQRTPLAFARSSDHGATWSSPREIESDPGHGYGYVSVTVHDREAILTYYDWTDRGQDNFDRTNLRQRNIPLAWLRGEAAPPVFRKMPEPVLGERAKIISINSGLLAEKQRWRLWYTQGTLDPKGEHLELRYAESRDHGATWEKKSWSSGLTGSTYHASAHREGDAIAIYAWRRDGEINGLYRLISRDDGRTFALEPNGPLLASQNASEAFRAQAGDGRISNDAFDVVASPGGYECFAAVLEKAGDARAVFRHDNAPGRVRMIGRATSGDGVNFSAVEVVLRPDYAFGDPFDTQFYGMQVLRHRGFHLGLLYVFRADSQIIQPEWAWSHDGQSWARTYVPCIPLGDEGAYDSRMIVFGDVTIREGELVWLYAGSDWRHNAFRRERVTTAIGRATLPLKELDAWLDSLPQP